MWNAMGPSGPLWGHAAHLGANDRYKLKSVSDLMKIAEGPPDSVSAGARRRAVRTALDTCTVATGVSKSRCVEDTCVEEPVLWEVAECDPDYEGEWDGTWELCTLEEDNGERCSVRIVSDGKLCKKVPRRFVRRKSLFPHLPRPLTQQLLDGHLGDVHDPRVLRTMAVLAEDLYHDRISRRGLQPCVQWNGLEGHMGHAKVIAWLGIDGHFQFRVPRGDCVLVDRPTAREVCAIKTAIHDLLWARVAADQPWELQA